MNKAKLAKTILIALLGTAALLFVFDIYEKSRERRKKAFGERADFGFNQTV
jgi:hypothetical protein